MEVSMDTKCSSWNVNIDANKQPLFLRV